jgi:SAM-dependent methyltransferase
MVVPMPSENRLPQEGGPGSFDPGSRWTDTFVVHSRNRIIHRIRFSIYERVFFRTVTDRSARILDVGCGSGEFISLLQQRGYRNLHGVEVDDALIGLASGVLPGIRKSSATELPYADSTFDCIYMFNVMHHLRDLTEYERALMEMSRCLRDGGRLILIEPCHLIFYRMLRFVCRVGGPFALFFRNFHTILQEEWPCLDYFLRHLDSLRQWIKTVGSFTVLEESMFLHQWITVITVNKGGSRAVPGQAGSCDNR